jgi:hypothetical protein
VQTPGNLTNPDPIQYNLLGEAAWPEEQRVFTDIVQPARDVWDNAFCYGGTFLVRRSALDEIGGIPEDSITEDLYSSYLLKAKGYKVRYVNEMLSEGLAAESLGSFIRQRCRWALGTLQCLYLDGGPLRARGLSFMDRMFFLDPVFFYQLLLAVPDPDCAGDLLVDGNSAVQRRGWPPDHDDDAAHGGEHDRAVLADRAESSPDRLRAGPRGGNLLLCSGRDSRSAGPVRA